MSSWRGYLGVHDFSLAHRIHIRRAPSCAEAKEWNSPILQVLPPIILICNRKGWLDPSVDQQHARHHHLNINFLSCLVILFLSKLEQVPLK